MPAGRCARPGQKSYRTGETRAHGAARGSRGRGARGAYFAQWRGARGAGQRSRAPLPTLSEGLLIGNGNACLPPSPPAQPRLGLAATATLPWPGGPLRSSVRAATDTAGPRRNTARTFTWPGEAVASTGWAIEDPSSRKTVAVQHEPPRPQVPQAPPESPHKGGECLESRRQRPAQTPAQRRSRPLSALRARPMPFPRGPGNVFSAW